MPERRSSGMAAEEPDPPREIARQYKSQRRYTGPLAGADFFRGGAQPVGKCLLDSERRAEVANRRLAEQHDDTAELRARLDGLTGIVDGVLAQIDRLGRHCRRLSNQATCRG